MIVARSRAELRTAIGPARGSGARVGLVPTMGALHDGHASLLDVAANQAEIVVCSIFVNPLQFGPGEDLERYPRTFDEDLELCSAHGVGVVFAPSADEVYPGGDPQVTVDPGALGGDLEGASRPGHFRGVLTVVAKLFGLVQPDLAYFGEKDYQQLALLTRMVDDLCLPIEVVGVDTVREPDGLAMSSRNRYLEPDQRRSAVALSRALFAGRAAADRGAARVVVAASEVLASDPGVELDYLELRGTDLGPEPGPGPARLLVAARVGTTRLIDNVGLELR